MSYLARLDASAICKAVVVAFVVGLAIGAMVGFVGFGLVMSDVLTDDMIENSIVLHGFIFCLGLLPDVIGGYLAAAFAGRNYLVHGVVAGTALLAISGVFYLFPDDDPFTLMDGIALLLTVPLAAVGSVIFQRTH
jgi:fructose-specific phosphotransferase system IIC component